MKNNTRPPCEVQCHTIAGSSPHLKREGLPGLKALRNIGDGRSPVDDSIHNGVLYAREWSLYHDLLRLSLGCENCLPAGLPCTWAEGAKKAELL